MAKFQLCEFRRNAPPPITNWKKIPAKGEGWERGIAKVAGFGDGCVEFIIDENGKRLKKEPFDFRVLGSYAHTTIDTEAEGAH